MVMAVVVNGPPELAKTLFSRAKSSNYFTIVYNSLEGAVSIIAGLIGCNCLSNRIQSAKWNPGATFFWRFR